jgi:hydroxymethylglutaryl-CoA reductase
MACETNAAQSGPQTTAALSQSTFFWRLEKQAFYPVACKKEMNMAPLTSAIPEFYKKSLAERIDAVRQFADLSAEEVALLTQFGSLDFETADRMIENVYSTHALPLGIATNFIVNKTEVLVPMALEEPSVVAAASNAARLCRSTGGFVAESDSPVMQGQVQLVKLKDAKKARQNILAHKDELLEAANAVDATLVKYGGGMRDIQVRELKTKMGDMLSVDLLVDVRDAMGANAINTMAERLTPKLEELSGGSARLRIISNLAVHRLARVKATWKKEELAIDSVTFKATGNGPDGQVKWVGVAQQGVSNAATNAS